MHASRFAAFGLAVSSALTSTAQVIGIVNDFGGDPRFGASMVVSDDITGDGLPDLIVGYTFAFADTNEIFVATPARNPSPTGVNPLGRLLGDSLDDFGVVVGGGADLNGDGVPDILAAEPGSDEVGVNSGRVLAIDGSNGAELGWATAGFALERFGESLLVVPDATGDGVADIVAASPNGDGARGRIALIDGAGIGGGSTGTAAIRWTATPGVNTGDRYGLDFAVLDDLTGDGRPEVAIGGNGRVVVLQLTNGQPAGFFFDGGSSFLSGAGQFGASLSSGADYNGDGVNDLLVGQPNGGGTDPDFGGINSL